MVSKICPKYLANTLLAWMLLLNYVFCWWLFILKKSETNDAILRSCSDWFSQCFTDTPVPFKADVGAFSNFLPGGEGLAGQKKKLHPRHVQKHFLNSKGDIFRLTQIKVVVFDANFRL